MKLKLKKPKPVKYRGEDIMPWSSSLPFVDNKRALLIHRPKSVSTVKTHKIPHVSVKAWCGNSFNGSDKFTFLEVAPDGGKLVCARCETIATMSGLPSSRELTGRHVHLGKLKAIKTCCSEAIITVEQTMEG